MKLLFNLAGGLVDRWIDRAVEHARESRSERAFDALGAIALRFPSRTERVMRGMVSAAGEDGAHLGLVSEIAVANRCERLAIEILGAHRGAEYVEQIGDIAIRSFGQDAVIPAIGTLAAIGTADAIFGIAKIGGGRRGFFLPALQTLFEGYRADTDPKTRETRLLSMMIVTRGMADPYNQHLLASEPSIWLSTYDVLARIRRETPASAAPLREEVDAVLRSLNDMARRRDRTTVVHNHAPSVEV